MYLYTNSTIPLTIRAMQQNFLLSHFSCILLHSSVDDLFICLFALKKKMLHRAVVYAIFSLLNFNGKLSTLFRQLRKLIHIKNFLYHQIVSYFLSWKWLQNEALVYIFAHAQRYIRVLSLRLDNRRSEVEQEIGKLYHNDAINNQYVMPILWKSSSMQVHN